MKKNMLGAVTLILLCLIMSSISAYGQINAAKTEKELDTSLKFFGYIRAWHQSDLSVDQSQFLLKQVRLGVSGNVNEYVGYKMLVDFARLGNLSTDKTTINGASVLTDASANFSDILLDAIVTITPVKGFAFTVGQFKIPFSTDNLRSGHSIAFANRPLLTKVAPSLRDIGFMSSYKIAGSFPINLSAGLFNGSGQNKTENDKTSNHVFRAVIKPAKNISVSANYYGGKTAGNNLSIIDFGANYTFGNIFVDAEYAQRQTESNGNDVKSKSYFAYLEYTLELKGPFLKSIIPAVRYESYDPGTTVSNNEINRTTIGATFNFSKFSFAHFRINYEKYDYKNGSTNPDKIILEFQARF